jgi:hypothetical protein
MMKFHQIWLFFVGYFTFVSCHTHTYSKYNGEKYQIKMNGTRFERPHMKFDPGHLGSINASEVHGIAFNEENVVNFFPTGIDEIFPQISRIVVENATLLMINREDLEPFTQLIEISLAHNKLRVLPENLFDANRNLTSINLSHNELTQIHHGIFDSLRHLHSVDLIGNPTVNHSAIDMPQLLVLIIEIKTNFIVQMTQNASELTAEMKKTHDYRDINHSNTSLLVIIAILGAVCLALAVTSCRASMRGRSGEHEAMIPSEDGDVCIEVRGEMAQERLRRESSIEFVGGRNEML